MLLKFRTLERESVLSFIFEQAPILSLTSGGQYELLGWLEHITFPMEAKFADAEFARKAYTSVVRRIIDSGVRYLYLCRLDLGELIKPARQPPAVITALYIWKGPRFSQKSSIHLASELSLV